MNINKEKIANIIGISLKELEELIKKKREEYLNMIDENTAIMLILKDKNIDIEKIYKTKVSDLRYKMKVNKINLKINKIILKKENLIVLECFDDTGKVKLIFKGDHSKLSNVLKENNFITVRNALVIKDHYLSLFTNKDYQITECKDIEDIKKISQLDPNNVYYVSQFICKILDYNNEVYKILTENFSLVNLKCKDKLELNKNYEIIAYMKSPLECIYKKEIY